MKRKAIRTTNLDDFARTLQAQNPVPSEAGGAATDETASVTELVTQAGEVGEKLEHIAGLMPMWNKLQELKPLLLPLLPPERRTEAWVERALHMIALAVQEDPNLRLCDTRSLFVAVAKAIAYGVEPGRELMECGIFAYQTDDGHWRAGFSLKKKGLIKTLLRTGKIVRIEADVVRAGDKFEYHQGTDVMIKHTKDLFAPEAGDIVGAYAIATFADGSRQIYVERKPVLDKQYRENAIHKDFWEKHETDAYTWAILRSLWKQLPSTIVDSELNELADVPIGEDETAVPDTADAHPPADQ